MVSAIDGHQPVILALPQTLILLPYSKPFLNLVIVATTLAQHLMILETLEVTGYK